MGSGFFATLRRGLPNGGAPQIVPASPAHTSHDRRGPEASAEIMLSQGPARATVGQGGARLNMAGGVSVDPEASHAPPPRQAGGGTVAARPALDQEHQRSSNPLIDAPTDLDVAVDLNVVTVLSAHGELAANSEQRKLLCLLSDGRLLVAVGADRFSPHVLSYITLLERRGFRHTPVQCRTTRITALYDAAGVEPDSATGKAALQTKAKSLALKMITEAAQMGASDVHLHVLHDHAELRYRVDGDLISVKEMDADLGMRLVRTFYQVLPDIGGETFKENEQLDARIGHGPHLPPGVDGIRIATTPTAQQTKLTMRLLYALTDDQGLEEMGFDDPHLALIDELQQIPWGINLISGPTGSGKSTTLQRTLLSLIKQCEGRKNVMTVEDPPEYPIPGSVQVPVPKARTLAARSEALELAISAAMRQDPDVLMIGEIRDLASAQLAFRAATTGHQVWATLHANNALNNVDRLVNIGMDKELLLDESVLQGLIAQRLVKKLCPHCKQPLHKHGHRFKEKAVERLRSLFGERYGDLYVAGQGCEHCLNGSKGRTAVVEIVRPSIRLCALMQEGKRAEARKHWLGEMGGQSFMQHTINKIEAGLVDPFAAIAVVGPLKSDAEALAELSEASKR